MSVPADNSRKNNANVVKRFKLSKKHFANFGRVWKRGHPTQIGCPRSQSTSLFNQ